MVVSSWEDLVQLGWSVRGEGGRRGRSYLRPDNRVVNKRRQLSHSEDKEFGDILFATSAKKRQLSELYPDRKPWPSGLIHFSPQLSYIWLNQLNVMAVRCNMTESL